MYINNANYFDTIQNFIRKILAIISIIHLSVFFNIETILGISVTWISTELYLRFILKRSNVILRPFSFIAISFLFLFMYFAPIVTLIDFNPIYNNMHLPLITFPLQLIYFSILILSFCLFNNYQNNKLTGIWKSFGFFNSISNKHLWLLAIGAWAIRLYLITNRYGEDGTNEIAGAGTLSFFATFIYAPLIIPFKNLYNIKSKYKTPQFDTPIILYIIATTLVNITSNSRNAIISIFIVLAIYFFLFFVKNKKQIKCSSKTIIWSIIILISFSFLSNLGIAMLGARSVRYGGSINNVFSTTINILTDKNKLDAIKKNIDISTKDRRSANLWDEYYCSNVFFQRLCNYKVVDSSIKYAYKRGLGDKTMLKDFSDRVTSILPGPICNALGFQKKSIMSSPMDILYSLCTNTLAQGFKVGGDVGLGISCFHYWYFIFAFIISKLLFYILDSLTYKKKNGSIISIIGLVQIYFIMFLFGVGGGLSGWIGFIYSLIIGNIIRLIYVKIVTLL